MRSNIVELAQAKSANEFKTEALKRLGDLSGVAAINGNILVLGYVAPQVSKGGIIMPEKTIDENRWQGVCGLVLKMCDTAFKYSGAYTYEGTKPEIGDWVVFHNSETREIMVRGTSCRLVHHELVRLVTKDPTIFW